MTRATLRELTTDEDWDDAVPILRQLWSHVEEDFVRSWRDEDGYRLFGLDADDELVAVAGVSVQRVLHHERHAWIHDFVVDQPHRGEGYGGELLGFIEDWARENECEHVSLAARLEKEDAQAFYEACEFDTWGFVMEKEL